MNFVERFGMLIVPMIFFAVISLGSIWETVEIAAQHSVRLTAYWRRLTFWSFVFVALVIFAIKFNGGN